MTINLNEARKRAREKGRSRALPADDLVTEDSAALIFRDRHAGQLLYCHDEGTWFRWSGSHWRKDRTRVAFDWARNLARELTAEQAAKSRISAGKTGFANGVEKFSQSDRKFAVTSDEWDPDLFLLGTPGDTIDLRTGRARPPSPNDRITRTTSVAAAVTADCPLWKQFLRQSSGGDDGMVRFLQQWCGYSLTGDTREHALIFVYGPGGNGKSVFLNTVAAISADYAATAAMDTFTASRNEKHPTDLAMLRGARTVTASETEEGHAWAESRIKHMTGGDKISARFMRQDFFTYKPQFKLTIVGNHKPILRNVDDAARRRFNIVPFILKPERPDPQLEAKLRNEWPAILRWMIDGCLDWQANGLVRPDSVRAATDAYFSDQDLMGQWLEERCDVKQHDPEHYWDRSADLFESWSDYALKSGEEPGTQKAFAQALQRRGFESRRTNAGRTFRGIRVKAASPMGNQ